MSESPGCEARRTLSRLLYIWLAAAVALGGVFVAASPARAADAPPPQARTGVLAPSATVDPLALPKAQAPANPTFAEGRTKGVRRIPHAAAALRSPVSPPQAEAAAVADRPPSGLLRNFNGVSSLDSALTNFGLEFEPPDQGLCVGNGFVLEAVNSAYTIYRRDGSVVAGPFNVNVLFDEGLAEFTSDPRCYYDHSSHTWFASILFISADNTNARTDIAVSTSGDPTKPWTVYHLDNTDDGKHGTPKHPGCPCFGDQPLLGIDRQNLYISTNEFSILGPEFNGAQIYVLAKQDLVEARPKVHFVQFENLTIAGDQAASVQPALTQDDPPVGYFLSALDPQGSGDNRLGVWALTNPGNVARGKLPGLANVVIPSESYSIPPGAVQRGASSLLDSGDDRMQQVAYSAGELWGALGTAVSLPGDRESRAGIAWFRVRPDLAGQKFKGARIVQQGYVAVARNYLLYPAIQPTEDGAAALVFTLSGAQYFPSAAYALLPKGQDRFGPATIAAAGTGPYDRRATRWGDYSWAALDPDGRSFWLATEYIPPPSSQTPNRRRNWGTRVLQVAAGGN